MSLNNEDLRDEVLAKMHELKKKQKILNFLSLKFGMQTKVIEG